MRLPNNSRQKERYNRAGNSALAWVSSASSLIASARILLRQYNAMDIDEIEIGENVPEELQVSSSVMLLYGFAVECLFKALWLEQGNFLVIDGEYKSPKGAGDHKLHELADITNFKTSKEEREILVRASIIITSTGRYPISKNWNETRIRQFYNGGFGVPNYISTGDFPIIEKIIERIYQDIDRG